MVIEPEHYLGQRIEMKADWSLKSGALLMFSIVLHLINYIITAPNTKSETFNLIGSVFKYYSLDDRLNHRL